MSYNFKTIIEPFRIKTVEPFKFVSEGERKGLLKEAGLNVFLLKSENVLLDLLTDSGTNAMSTEQWAGIMRGDESYAGSPSYYRFETAVRTITSCPEVIPTHQGRAAEHILFNTLTKPGKWIISNSLFDTTRANAEVAGCLTLDLPCKEAADTATASAFKGNIDLERLEQSLKEKKGEVAMVVMTITNNSGGGQPVSLANLKAARELCKAHGALYVIDGCRYAENAWFIKQREKGYEDKTPLAIAQECFKLADIISFSAKKDAMGNIGGFLAMHDKDSALLCRNALLLTEGFPTYGGLAGRDLEAIGIGLFESLDEHYLRYRIRSIAYIGDALMQAGVPILNPPGGHAIYVDAKRLLPHIPVSQYPGQALVASLYEFAGVRAVEIGSVMFGREKPDGTETPHQLELVRLTIPRRVYTQSHMDYLVEALIAYKKDIAPTLKGVKFTYKPKVLRHFTSRFEWV